MFICLDVSTVECGSVIVEDVLVMVSHSLSLSDELTAGSLHQWVDGGHPAVTSSHTDHKIDGRRIVFGQSNFLLHPMVLPCIETYRENLFFFNFPLGLNQ